MSCVRRRRARPRASVVWCPGRESNPHGRDGRQFLRLVCLPVPPPGRGGSAQLACERRGCIGAALASTRGPGYAVVLRGNRSRGRGFAVVVRCVRLRLRLRRCASMRAPDYQNACGAPSRLVHSARLAAQHRPSTWRPFLECGLSLVASVDSTFVLPPTLRAVRGATPYVRTRIDHLGPCGPSATSVQLALPRLTPLSADAGNVFAF